ncbi:telomerase reverse transcriptase [Colletotrichum truncatum]|uniref:Telomerase reverse transcriptase n=1 Tax=Colletotrichum truncatum TaxID=5467 RepID=A0ACC3Z5I4_COLTU|nr:telomerase reverse transcriptase [Colletotrichum truncatum]KAF6795248.1 telomerase reverse transcriptase [Colletotrichum truncatum]
MPVKRKAHSHGELRQGHPPLKKVKVDRDEALVKHSLLQQHYGNVQTLRAYLLSKLPSSSRLRRKKITSVGSSPTILAEETKQVESCLSTLLDTTLVCTQHHPKAKLDSRWEQWQSFSQKGDESVMTLSGGLAGATCSQSEIVDFVIWQLFSRVQANGYWPKHLLCDGFRRRGPDFGNARGPSNYDSVPGLTSVHPNHSAQVLKGAPWPQVLMLLGKSGEQIMIDLLIDTAIFVPVQAGVGNVYQLSGIPMLEIDPLATTNPRQAHGQQVMKPKDSDLVCERLPSEIVFMRNRMLYARAALTSRGTVHYGLRHIHVLSRCPLVSYLEQTSSEEKLQLDQANERSTQKIIMYIFPRQFGLHNVFTSKVDHLKTAQKLPDYTLREEEISLAFKNRQIRMPKRLRGDVRRLVQQLQRLHNRCSYAELLRHYCPSALDTKPKKPAVKKTLKQSQKCSSSQTLAIGTQKTMPVVRGKGAEKSQNRSRQQAPPMPVINFDAITDLATPTAHVSAFCRAVLARLVPNEFWGTGDSQAHNREMVFKKVDHFVRLRRFESMNLQEVLDGLKITCMDWLAPPALRGLRTSQTDMKKRLEILNEFLYYVFDSILIPLLRSNFYITESSSHRYRIFYFRHDVWRYVAEPAMATLKANMFEEVKINEVNRILGSRRLGFSRIRLLPKGKSMRPITNLRRRVPVTGKSTILGPSINSVLAPVHSMLRLETERNPSKLGSSLFSVGDIYARLNAFSANFGKERPKFYFAKLDVQSAFDTIPQEAVIRLMGVVPSEDQYIIKKHLEIKAGLVETPHRDRPVTKVTRRWHSLAATRDDPTSFVQVVESRLGVKGKNAVFVGNMSRKEHNTRQLMALMASHIQQNLVKVGKKFYRQKNGIPQGSVLSSALCNYFYADLEAQHLSFLADEDCLLLRLIDDFLLITTSQRKARNFVKIMHRGLPEYGVAVNPNKTLVNFDMEFGGASIAKVSKDTPFPYCGVGIDCETLDITKVREKIKGTAVSDALTVDFGSKSGQNFQRRVLNALKIQSHLMFYDTNHNTLRTVMSNLHKAFIETAEKMWSYWRCLPTDKQPDSRLVIKTIGKLIDVAFVLLTGKTRKKKHPHYSCALEKTQVFWLALDAVRKVLTRKQANFAPVLSWIDAELSKLESTKTTRAMKVMKQLGRIATARDSQLLPWNPRPCSVLGKRPSEPPPSAGCPLRILQHWVSFHRRSVMDDRESQFLVKLAAAGTYPDSLLQQDERGATIRARREHYNANRAKIFDGVPSRIDTPLVIIDFGGSGCSGKTENDPKKAELHIIRDLGGLRRKLSWPERHEATTGSANLIKDPALRIVLLERLSPTSLLLNLDEDVLFELLTYHQVPFYLLSFLVSGGDSWSFASSIRFTGFRGAVSLPTNQDTGIASLGRSGARIQLCFALFSIREYPLHALPRGVNADRTPRWEPHSAVMYLHFDLVEGTAVWFLASPRCHNPVRGMGMQNQLWNELKESLAGKLGGIGSLDVSGRFHVSLECLLAVAEWAVGELALHFQDLETRLSDLTKPYLHPYDDSLEDDIARESIHEQDLRRMAFLMEQRHESIMRIDNNLRALRCLRGLLVDELCEKLASSGVRHADEMREHIEEFRGKLASTTEEMGDLLDRAQALDKLAKNREEYIQQMQTQHTNRQMKSIAELTAYDSAAMKQLSFIALVLLPVTVVSTVLSTDIVKFQDLSNGNENAAPPEAGQPHAPVPVYSFSAAAFGTWAVASVVMTVVTLAIVRPLGSGRIDGLNSGCKNFNKQNMVRQSTLKERTLHPCNLRGVSRSAQQDTPPSEPSPASRSIHTAPTMTKTASNSPEAPVADVSTPVQAGSQTLTSMSRWLGTAWGTLWRQKSGGNTTSTSVSATALPR